LRLSTSNIGDGRLPAHATRTSPRAVARATFAAIFAGRQSDSTHIEALTLAIDRDTLAHSCRVRSNTMALASAAGIADADLLAAIAAGGLLHDIGKLAIPHALLQKPGPLEPHEFEQVKRHAALGAQMLADIDTPEALVAIVRHHHENWDGTGYPDGLAGSAIPLGARVLAIIDCYDALTSDRPYRRALSPDRAVAMIRERCGTMYDPAIVRAFLSVQPTLASALAGVGGRKEPAA
jgi:putative two-component system response regulator